MRQKAKFKIGDYFEAKYPWSKKAAIYKVVETREVWVDYSYEDGTTFGYFSQKYIVENKTGWRSSENFDCVHRYAVRVNGYD